MENKIKVLTFAKGDFIDSQLKLNNHLKLIGINNIINYNDELLPISFKKIFNKLLKNKKGYGFCIWKPFIILRELVLLKDDEILFYIDSTDLPEKILFEKILSHFEINDYLFFNRGYNQGQWTKRDAFIIMDCDSELFYNSIQLEAGCIALKRSQFNIDLIMEWFLNCMNENALTNCSNICNQENINNFKDHRYDQSILTNLIIKYSLNSYEFDHSYIKYNYNQPQF